MYVADQVVMVGTWLEKIERSSRRRKEGRMTAENGLKKRNILVGIKFDRGSKDLLSWAIVKVSDPGDHILALRLCRNPDDKSKERLLLDSYLEIYKELCQIKMVAITGLVLTGDSIKKTLVKEAKNQSAVALLVGTTKQSTLGGGWVSTAKYCAKHLPPTTQVITVHNGRVVFRSTSTDQLHKGLEDPKPSLHIPKTQSSSQSQSEFGGSDTSELTTATNTTTDTHTTTPSHHLPTCPERGSRDGSCTSGGYSREWKHGLFLHHNNKKRMIQPPQEFYTRSVSFQAETIPGRRPIGWPLLLRKASLPTQTALDFRKMSVVQWVMNLPDRSDTNSPQTTSSCCCNSSASSSCVSDSCCSSKSESPLGRREDHRVVGTSNSIDRFSIWSEVSVDEYGVSSESRSSDFTWFSYDVLRNSTSQFSSENLIGNGGCSKVYKGVFPDGKQVAVRVIKSSQEAWKDFSLEVNIVSSLKHTNITSLLGVCIENKNLISVYEFKSGGNLEDSLHEKPVLPWEARYKVAIGVAEALNYLHNGLSRPVIHRDVKSSNILLSDGFEPQLSDFGLAIWGPSSSSSSFETYNDVVGTFGYLAPEYFMYGRVSDKIDVYSFGVVLLELLSGKKPIGSGSSKGQQSLVMWAKPILETGKLFGILDSNLEGNFDEDQMQRMVLAATLCLTTSARLRPDMSNVLKLLRGDEPVEKWMRSSHSLREEDGCGDPEANDDEVYVDAGARSHLNLAFDDVDDFMSCTSMDQGNGRLSLGEYLKGRWNRSSRFS